MLLSLVMAVLQPLGAVAAWALTPVDIQEADTGYYVREWSGEYTGSCYDANPANGGEGEVYHRYYGSDGDYVCLDIRRAFFTGPHQGCNMLEASNNGKPYSAETVRRCALAVRWCAENRSGDEAVVVRQAFVWRIVHDAGNMSSWYNTYDSAGVDVARYWNEFNAWYAAHADEYDCAGTVWWTHNDGDQLVAHLTSSPKPGGLRLQKVSARPEVSGGDVLYSLAGARYGVWSGSGDKVAELVTGADGTASVGGLAPGTYYVHETSASAGFAIDASGGEAPGGALADIYGDKGWYKVQVASNAVTAVGGGKVLEQPLVAHLGVLLVKHALETAGAVDGTPLAGAEYELARYANLDGSVDGTPTAVWTVRTNDKGEVDLRDPDCVVDGSFATGDDGLAELKPGTYTVREVGAPAGFALELAGDSDASGWTCVDKGGEGVAPTYSFVLGFGSDANRDGAQAPNLCDRAVPAIGTTLAGVEGEKDISNEATTLVDTVSYQGLVVGLTYVLEGRLVTAEGDEVATAQVEFVPETGDGTQEVAFEELDLTELIDRDVICLERLTLDGTVVATHEDMDDEGQTVHVYRQLHPSIGTTLAGTNGEKDIAVGTTTLVDTVAYHDLVAGQTYVLEASLVTLDGKAFATAKVEFEPEEGDGTQKVTFTELDLSGLAGRDVVCLERLTLDGELVASHEDLGDKGQTVHIQAPRTIVPRTGDVTTASGITALAAVGACSAGLACAILVRSRHEA